MATAYKIREIAFRMTPAGNNTTVTFLDAVKAGDTLFVIAGGGSNPYAMSGDSLSSNPWTEIPLAHKTGQEAQGNAWSRVMDADLPAGTTANIQWDGGDQCGVALIHYRGDIEFSLDFVQRTGSVGSSGSAITTSFTAPANSTTYFYAFQRNSGGVAATVDSGAEIMLGGGAVGNQGVSFYRQQFPDVAGTPGFHLTAGRSGAYLVGLSIFVPVGSDWADADPFWFEEGVWSYGGHNTFNTAYQDVTDNHIVSPVNDGLYQPDEQASANAAWNLTPRINTSAHKKVAYASSSTPSSTPASYFSQLNDKPTTGNDYNTFWQSCYTSIALIPTATAPEPSVPSDPDAYDVEFRNNVKTDIRFIATPRQTFTSPGADIGTAPSTWYDWSIHYELVSDYTVLPALRTRADMLALSEAHRETFSFRDVTDAPGADIDLGSLGVTPDYDGDIRFVLVDHFTKTGVCYPPMTGHTDGALVQAIFDYAAEGYYELEYRYLYRGLVALVPISGAMGPSGRNFTPPRGVI